MTNEKSLYVVFIAIFILFETLFALSLLDYPFINIADYDRTGIGDDFFGWAIGIIFFIGITLGWALILKTDGTSSSLKTIKWIYSLFYILSPLLFLFYTMIKSGVFSGEFLNGNSLALLYFVILPLFALLLAASLLFIVYFYDIAWSKGKKIFFGIYNFIIGIISTILVMITTGLAMLDHGLS